MSGAPATPAAAAPAPPAMPKAKRAQIPKAPTSEPPAPTRPPEVVVVPSVAAVQGAVWDKVAEKTAENIVDRAGDSRTPLVDPRDPDNSPLSNILRPNYTAAPPPGPAPSRRRAAQPPPSAGDGFDPNAPPEDVDKESQSLIRIYNQYVKMFSNNPQLKHLSWLRPEAFAGMSLADKKRYIDVVRTGVNTNGSVGDLRGAFADLICGIANAMNIAVARGILSPQWMIEDIEQLREDVKDDPDPNFEIELQQLYCEWIEWLNLGPTARLGKRTFQILSSGTPGLQQRKAARNRAARNTKPPTGSVYEEV